MSTPAASARVVTLPVRRRPHPRRRPVPPVGHAIRPARVGFLDRVPSAVVWACVVAASVGVHLALVRAAGHMGALHPMRAVTKEAIHVVVRDRPLPPREVPPPEPPKVVKLARAQRPPKNMVPQPTPPPQTPPPETPPPETKAPPSNQPPLLVPGMALSSTSTAGSFAVATGNTLAGAPGAGSGAPPPAAAGTDREGLGKIAPSYALTEEPVFLDNVTAAEVRRFYPESARKAKIEGIVRTKLTLDREGHVARVVVTEDPGNGFAAAALKLARLYRFKPARINGQPVATEISFTIHFELD